MFCPFCHERMLSKTVEGIEDVFMSDAFDIDIDDEIMERENVKIYVCKKCGFTRKTEI